jgi:HlyD family secretion protein
MARQLLSSRKATDPQGDALAVLEFQSPTAALIATPVPRSTRSVTLWVGFGVIAMMAAACVIKTDKIVTGQGSLASTDPTVQIQPLQTAIVHSILVHPGQLVHKGDLLAELDPTFSSADMQADQEQVESYTAQIDRLKAQLAGKPYVPATTNSQTALQLESYNELQAQYQAGVANFDQQIASLQAQLQQAQSDAEQYSQRLALANSVEAMRSQLQQMQVGSRLDSLAAADNRLSMAGNLADAVASARKAIGDIASTKAQRDAFIRQWFSNLAQQLQQAENQLAPAQQSLTKDGEVHQLVMLRAPSDAVVLNLSNASVGSVLQAGQQFLSLTPMGTPLQAVIDLNGTESGYVNVGDKVDVKLTTLPYLMYGDLKGTVESISSNSFDPEQVQQGSVSDVSGSAPSGLFYRARIKILENKLHNLPAGFALMPGMPLQGDVNIGKRTVAAYLMKRVLPAFTGGMREPN